MLSLQGTACGADRRGERDDAAAAVANASATATATMGARVIRPFYTFGGPGSAAATSLGRVRRESASAGPVCGNVTRAASESSHTASVHGRYAGKSAGPAHGGIALRTARLILIPLRRIDEAEHARASKDAADALRDTRAAEVQWREHGFGPWAIRDRRDESLPRWRRTALRRSWHRGNRARRGRGGLVGDREPAQRRHRDRGDAGGHR